MGRTHSQYKKGALPRKTVMCPFVSQEMLDAAVEMVCYFCTAIGVVLAILFAPRG